MYVVWLLTPSPLHETECFEQENFMYNGSTHVNMLLPKINNDKEEDQTTLLWIQPSNQPANQDSAT